jgi:hypothetical protein
MKGRFEEAWRGLGIVAAIAGAAVCVAQHHAIARATLEHQTLLKDSAETSRLTRENADLEKQRALYVEVKSLHDGRTELARLRGEWERLRAQTSEMEKLRSENQQLARVARDGETNTALTNYISRADLADLGLDSPEAAVETFFYAATQGDFTRMLQSQGVDAVPGPEDQRNAAASLRRDFSAFPGYAITEKKMISLDEAQIGVKAVTGGITDTLHIVHTGNQWIVK